MSEKIENEKAGFMSRTAKWGKKKVLLPAAFLFAGATAPTILSAAADTLSQRNPKGISTLALNGLANQVGPNEVQAFWPSGEGNASGAFAYTQPACYKSDYREFVDYYTKWDYLNDLKMKRVSDEADIAFSADDAGVDSIDAARSYRNIEYALIHKKLGVPYDAKMPFPWHDGEYAWLLKMRNFRPDDSAGFDRHWDLRQQHLLGRTMPTNWKDVQKLAQEEGLTHLLPKDDPNYTGSVPGYVKIWNQLRGKGGKNYTKNYKKSQNHKLVKKTKNKVNVVKKTAAEVAAAKQATVKKLAQAEAAKLQASRLNAIEKENAKLATNAKEYQKTLDQNRKEVGKRVAELKQQETENQTLKGTHVEAIENRIVKAEKKSQKQAVIEASKPKKTRLAWGNAKSPEASCAVAASIQKESQQEAKLTPSSLGGVWWGLLASIPALAVVYIAAKIRSRRRNGQARANSAKANSVASGNGQPSGNAEKPVKQAASGTADAYTTKEQCREEWTKIQPILDALEADSKIGTTEYQELRRKEDFLERRLIELDPEWAKEHGEKLITLDKAILDNLANAERHLYGYSATEEPIEQPKAVEDRAGNAEDQIAPAQTVEDERVERLAAAVVEAKREIAALKKLNTELQERIQSTAPDKDSANAETIGEYESCIPKTICSREAVEEANGKIKPVIQLAKDSKPVNQVLKDSATVEPNDVEKLWKPMVAELRRLKFPDAASKPAVKSFPASAGVNQWVSSKGLRFTFNAKGEIVSTRKIER